MLLWLPELNLELLMMMMMTFDSRDLCPLCGGAQIRISRPAQFQDSFE
jgi:hypothetical protein